MKKLFLGLLASVSVTVFAVACGSNNNNNPQPLPAGPQACINQPGTVWNGAQCVYNANCAGQPGTIWNGNACMPNNFGGQFGQQGQFGQPGFNSSCTAGMIYTFQGCLPQGTCPIGQAQSMQGCVQAMNTNGGWGNAGWGNAGWGNAGWGNAGWGGGAGWPTTYPTMGNGYYPTYYSAPRAGVYLYGRMY